MYIVLAIVCGLVGLAVTGTAVYTAWQVYTLDAGRQAPASSSEIEAKAAVFLRWTALDYAVLVLFCGGMLFLFADLTAVIRDRDSYPFYHYGYLLGGFVFCFLGMFFTLVRLALVLRLSRRRLLSSPNENRQPVKADQTEQRVERS